MQQEVSGSTRTVGSREEIVTRDEVNSDDEKRLKAKCLKTRHELGSVDNQTVKKGTGNKTTEKNS